MFQGGTGGVFDSEANLRAPGRVRYEPYRSGSHYDMGQAIGNDGFAVVELDDRGVRRVLKVSLQEYGVLEILTSSEASA